MVNLCRTLMMPRGPKTMYNDGYWRKRQVFKMSAHFYGRARNCFSIAIRRVQRALQYVVVGRKLRKEWYKDMWEDRITAGCREFGNIPQGSTTMMEALERSQVHLNRQSLASFAVFEPRTFKALNSIAADKAKQDNLHPNLGPSPQNIKGKLP